MQVVVQIGGRLVCLGASSVRWLLSGGLGSWGVDSFMRETGHVPGCPSSGSCRAWRAPAASQSCPRVAGRGCEGTPNRAFAKW
jgi:hypothetical protein